VLRLGKKLGKSSAIAKWSRRARDDASIGKKGILEEIKKYARAKHERRGAEERVSRNKLPGETVVRKDRKLQTARRQNQPCEDLYPERTPAEDRRVGS